MPEYLSPGVFIEEIPARLKAIEGVSTSTAGFVGAAERGPVAGFPLPFTPVLADPQRVTVPPDLTPVLITSFADFTRQFGAPFPDPDPVNGYLGHAVRAFFDNGGKRCFVARVVGSGAARASVQIHQGTVLRLARRAQAGDTVVSLTSLRGVTSVAPNNNITFFNASDGTGIGAALQFNSYDTQANTVTLAAALALPAGVTALVPDQVFVRPGGVAAPTAGGPTFFARNSGTWGGGLRVLVTNAERPPVPLTAGAAATVQIVQVQSASSFYRGAIVEIDHGAPAARTYHEVTDILSGNRLQLRTPLGSAVTTAGFARVVEIAITIIDQAGNASETFGGLTWNPSNDPEVRRRHYSTVVNTRSRLAYVQPPGVAGAAGGEAATLAAQPITDRGVAAAPLAANAGAAGGPPGNADVVGIDNGPGARTGIQSLQDVDDIRIVAAPGFTATVVQNELVTQCERMRYRFAVLDGERDPAPANVVIDILRHRNAYDSSFAAYYTPWVEIADGDRTLVLPPSGYAVGIYARTDNERGVHKAPANEVVRNITGLRLYITTGEQDILNPRHVNAIRRFEGRGIRVWGARTLSSDPEFRYVNVRRFLIFMEASIDRGTQWVVFEPNSPETWSRVVDSVSAFLHTQWRNGALLGRKPEDAFFVRCDETTMTADDIQNGRLICNIGVAIVRPAEFVIFRIEQITAFGTRS